MVHDKIGQVQTLRLKYSHSIELSIPKLIFQNIILWTCYTLNIEENFPGAKIFQEH